MEVLAAITLSDIGLMLDIAGAYLIYQFTLKPIFPSSGPVNVMLNPETKRRMRRDGIFTKIGITSLIVGFALQIAGNH
jgi:hypothetical protein